MPKRSPGGRVKRTQKEKRRVATPVAARTPTAAAEPLAPRERAEATQPARTAPATGTGRQSLLAGVRRPARSNAPSLVTDYAYVMSDLRRIGVLAGAAFVLLVALTFVIR